MSSDQLRIAINAQKNPDSGSGGVSSVLVGLLSALSRLEGNEHYIIVGTPENREWLSQFTGNNQEIIIHQTPLNTITERKKSFARRLFTPLARPAIRALRKELGYMPSTKPLWPQVPLSDGFWESLGCKVVHFPYQDYVVCSLPSVYNPHDLQHLHYPQYFPPKEIAKRETIYSAGCHFANTVVVASQWIKNDIIKNYAIDPGKIQVIPWAPPTETYPLPTSDEIEEVKRKYSLHLPFALYPAMTWEHKNHLRLIEGYNRARKESDIHLQIICTGKQHEPHWSKIQKLVEKLGLTEDVRFLGLLSEKELRCLYRQATFVIVPTLFEAASGPVFEAWHDNVPVACSTVTSLPEQVADGALLFDPFSVDAIKETLLRLTNEPALREKLITKGTQRLHDFSWSKTAKAFRAVYRRAAGVDLTNEDEQLLAVNWMAHAGTHRT